MKLDPRAARAAVERASQRAPMLPGDPIEAIARARAAQSSKRLTLTGRVADLFRKKDKGFGDLRARLEASVAERADVMAETAAKLPVDPPEVEYIAHRRAAAG